MWNGLSEARGKSSESRGQADGAEAARKAPGWQGTGICVGFNKWED